ncbi:MAG TPA: DUF262 domain-containing HNH endonuclease family protein [Candidatus Omnitrophota bacterium]|nr:DUF262 domain-containing HNH endonuclease family protein [Candidatus Omnitrophota bacterium]
MNQDVKDKIFIPAAKTIEQIFGDADSFFIVPDYQRPYSWESEQVEALWDDIYDAMNNGDESYFLGPVILTGPDPEERFQVVDGQQRLTTLTILFCVLRDLFLPEDKMIADAIKSLKNEKFRLRFVSQSSEQNRFEAEILQKVKFPPAELSERSKKENRFANAAMIFRDKLTELSGEGKAISGFIDYLLKRVIMITITCTHPSFAVKLFQVLNTRGLDLSPADLIKSFLYQKCEPARSAQFLCTWREIETLAESMGEPLADLLTYYEYYLLAANPREGLFEELTRLWRDSDSNAVVFEFSKFVKAFSEIFQSSLKIINGFWYLPNQFYWKAILTTARMNGYDDFQRLALLMRRLFYFYWIAGYTSTKTKQMTFNIIQWIKAKKTVDEMACEIEAKMERDQVLKRAQENLSGDVYGESWLRALLMLVEYEQTDDSKIEFIELDSRLHVDHILPGEWHKKEEWRQDWTRDDAFLRLNSLGNMTLLSGRKNIVASNDPFPVKKEIYRKGHGGMTAFMISRKILEKDKWTKREVDERQSWLLSEAQRIFSV